MKLVQSRLCWLLTLFLGLSIVAGIASMAQVQGASHQQFTLTEVDPTGNRVAGWWQYRAVANTAPGGFSRRQDSPWHWRHYGQYEIDNYGTNCGDNIFALYPANPNSPDTVVSADGGTITVNIYQEIDTVWICFALECDDGTFAYAQMRNLQTETTVSGNGCGEGSSSDTTQSPPPDNNNNGGNDSGNNDGNTDDDSGNTMVIPTTTRGTNGGTVNPLLPPAEINPDGDDGDDDSDQDNSQDQNPGNTNPPPNNQKTDDADNDEDNNAPPPQPKSPVVILPPVTQDSGQTAGDDGASDSQDEDDTSSSSNQKQPRSPYNGPWK